MKTIWKFPIEVTDRFELVLPVGARVIWVAAQGPEGAVLWAEVDTDAPTETRRFRLVGTGHALVEGLEYLGSFQLLSGSFVGHLYEDTFDDEVFV